MKKKIRVYLDTSVISALFDDRNPERKSLTETFFDQIENLNFDPYISEITVIEIERTPDPLLSWNFKHIVRRKTRDIVKMVNTLNSLRQLEIMTPAELL